VHHDAYSVRAPYMAVLVSEHTQMEPESLAPLYGEAAEEDEPGDDAFDSVFDLSSFCSWI